ncbi:MAG: competence/damage-inducible protein A [Candidatus Marinimicrobia bacterium]|nr:competence/damage-inducible protein A [Candidatus Neomarinimicrobiota bacterium]MBT3618275.1 competence/damage-inducible protein A [Candidatus Neomarinimicrobiota bacterium]MBT3828220.1 competence/damage-inducible protein A [Candidatus Neomarinimicrobiota bacterium]MBT3997137.1 competence/damage-inducible protein A [Candidatus Neomarinimicrobiota bacterium]MBT4280603.1 competence/damage-inducible protein A [Candidatus Neomarinimicrobiota bacterium]
MKIGLITIGNELLSGFTTNTNASWIGKRMSEIGAEIVWHHTVQDSHEAIVNSFNSIPTYLNALIITGGLGPTHDDITANSLFDWADVETEFDDDYWQDLKRRFKSRHISIPDLNKNQALKPINGELIPNPLGSARGIQLQKNGMDIVALPGVPVEMKAMMVESVIPFLKINIQNPIHILTLRTTGIMESALAEKLEPILKNINAKLAFLPKLTGVDLRISSKDKKSLTTLKESIYQRVGKYIFGENGISLEEIVGKLILDKQLTISIAESCTGGLISDRLTNVPGSSGYLLGSVIAYQNEVKISKLGVKKETIEKFGAVSEQTANEMAKGIRSSLKSNLGLSSTGIAGPGGGSEEKPVGLVYIALANDEEVLTKKLNLTKNRLANKKLTSQAAINLLRLYLLRE